MPQGLEHAFDDGTVYRRTHEGRAALLRLPSTLSPAALRLLARVNGFTDLRALLDQDGDPQARVAPAIEALLQQGLIEAVAKAPPPVAVPRRSDGSSLAA